MPMLCAGTSLRSSADTMTTPASVSRRASRYWACAARARCSGPARASSSAPEMVGPAPSKAAEVTPAAASSAPSDAGPVKLLKRVSTMLNAGMAGAAGKPPTAPEFFMPPGSEQGLQGQANKARLVAVRLVEREGKIATQRAERRVPQDRGADRALEGRIRARVDRHTRGARAADDRRVGPDRATQAIGLRQHRYRERHFGAGPG